MKKFFLYFSAFAFVACLVLSEMTVNAAIDVSAKSAVVLDSASSAVLFEKNAYEKLPMASTTKIMTGLILAEEPNLDREITVTKEMVTVEGSSMGLIPGDTVSLYALLCGLMLASGNDAANTIAIVLCGSTEKFAEVMNNKARQIGMENTNFVTPSGLDDENHYSTAYDMAMLASEALRNPIFAEVVSSKSKTVSYGNPPYLRTLKNHNKMLSLYDGAVGVKTGFTKKSGRCLVSAAAGAGSTVIAVTLNDPDDWNDHQKMLDYGISNSAEFISDKYFVPLVGGESGKVEAVCRRPNFEKVYGETDNLKYSVSLPKFVYPDIKKGDVLGSVEVLYKGVCVFKGDISAVCDYGAERIDFVPKPDFFYMFKKILSFK